MRGSKNSQNCFFQDRNNKASRLLSFKSSASIWSDVCTLSPGDAGSVQENVRTVFQVLV